MTEERHQDRGHSTLSPSGAHRWAYCPASVWDSQGLADTSSVWAAVGTRQHEVAAICLTEGKDPEFFIGSSANVQGFDVEFTQEMADAMSSGLEVLRDRIACAEFHLVEQWLDLTHLLGRDPFTKGPQGGSLDFGAVLDSGTSLYVFDWKFGQEPVNVVENLQLILYALAFYAKLGRKASQVKTVRLRIEQPYVEGGGGTWDLTLDELIEWGEWLRRRAARVSTHQNVYRPGPKTCRWCKVRESEKRCKAYDDYMFLSMAEKMPDAREPTPLPTLAVDPETLSPARKAYIVKHKSAIEKWLEQIHASLIDDALKGRPTPGFKLVDGRRGAREWSDELRARRVLRKLVRDGLLTESEERKLKSPAKLEKELGKNRFAKYVSQTLLDQSPGKPVLVDDEDQRAALPALIDRMPEAEDENGKRKKHGSNEKAEKQGRHVRRALS